MKKNLLITGGAGFIGSNLIKFIIQNKLSNKIIVLDNYSSGFK
jgi:UDP-glucose 4-epimerase